MVDSRLGALLLAISRSFNLSPDGPGIGVWDWDVPNDLVYADAISARLFGLESVEAAEGQPLAMWSDRMHPDDRERVTSTIKAVFESSKRFVDTYRVARIDGGYRWIHAIGDCTFSPAGQPLRYSGLMVDVSGGSRSASVGVLRIEPRDIVIDLVSAAKEAGSPLEDDLLDHLLDVVLFHLLKDREGSGRESTVSDH